jgi:hypothetical protein
LLEGLYGGKSLKAKADFPDGETRDGNGRKNARSVVIPVAFELRSPATAFGRVDLFSFSLS